MSESGIRIRASAAIIRDGTILLVEYDDPEVGPHYNLPGGGVKVGESVRETVRREVREETTAEVEVGQLLLVWEYVPSLHGGRYGPQQGLGLLFHGKLAEGTA